MGKIIYRKGYYKVIEETDEGYTINVSDGSAYLIIHFNKPLNLEDLPKQLVSQWKSYVFSESVDSTEGWIKFALPFI